MIPQHSLDIQMLHSDRLVLTSKLRGMFMQEILADVRNLLVYAGDAYASLVSISRLWHLARKPALLTFQPCPEPVEVSRIPYDMTEAIRIECADANIDANHATCVGPYKIFLILLHAERDKVLAGSNSAYRGRENPAIAVPALLDFHKTDFRQLDSLVNNTDAVLLVPRPVGLAVTMF